MWRSLVRCADKIVQRHGVFYVEVPRTQVYPFMRRVSEKHRATLTTVKQFLAPPHMLDELITMMHDAPTGAHFGAKRTWEKCQQHFYWPFLYRFVKDYVATCTKCTEYKARDRTSKAPMHIVEPPEYPFERVGIDLIGPFRRSRGLNLYALVIQDYYTKWLQVVPIVSKHADHVAKAMLKSVFSVHGPPKYLHSDRGTEFENALLRRICQMFGVRKTRSTSHHPASNGMVERSNKTLKNAISTMVDLDQLNWDERLPYFTFAYNTSIHASTGCTPHFLLYGYEARQPVDMMLHQQEVVTNDSRFKRTLVNIANWREEIDRVIQETYPDMKAKQKFYHDQKTHYKFLEVGDEAWLKNFKPRARGENKLNVRMRGPYRVVETFDKAPHTYRLQHKLNPDDMQVAHWSNLQFGKTNRRVGAENYYNCADDGSGRMPKDDSGPPGAEKEADVLRTSGSVVEARGAGLLKPMSAVFEPVRGFDERSEHLSDIDLKRGMEEEEEDDEEDGNETEIKKCWQRERAVTAAEQRPINSRHALSTVETSSTDPSASAERRSGRIRKCPERYGYEKPVDGEPHYADRKHAKVMTVNTNRLVGTSSQPQLRSSRSDERLADAERRSTVRMHGRSA